jgi:hypothetical protein
MDALEQKKTKPAAAVPRVLRAALIRPHVVARP